MKVKGAGVGELVLNTNEKVTCRRAEGEKWLRCVIDGLDRAATSQLR